MSNLVTLHVTFHLWTVCAESHCPVPIAQQEWHSGANAKARVESLKWVHGSIIEEGFLQKRRQKVVTVSWGTELLQFLTALVAILHQEDLMNRLICTRTSWRIGCKSAYSSNRPGDDDEYDHIHSVAWKIPCQGPWESAAARWDKIHQEPPRGPQGRPLSALIGLERDEIRKSSSHQFGIYICCIYCRGGKQADMEHG